MKSATRLPPFASLGAGQQPAHTDDKDISENLPGKPGFSRTKSQGPQALFMSLVTSQKRRKEEQKKVKKHNSNKTDEGELVVRQESGEQEQVVPDDEEATKLQ